MAEERRAAGSFTLEVPQSIDVYGGQSSQSIVKVIKSPGRPKVVTLSVVDVPAGMAADIFPENGRPNFQSTLTITPSDALADGNYSIFVHATDGEIIRSMPITVVKAGLAAPQPPVSAPVLTSLTPNNINEDSAGFSLQINGSGFISGAQAFWNGSARTISFVSSSRIDATINAADIVNPGTASITATNPGSSSSNSLTFTINAVGGGANYYVSKSGNNSWDGTSPTFVSGTVGPKLTIAGAFSIIGTSAGAGAGKTIRVMDGTAQTYVEAITDANCPTGTSGNPFTLDCNTRRIITLRPSAVRIIDFTSAGGAKHVIVKGFILDAALTSGNVVYIARAASNFTLDDCECKNGQPGDGTPAGSYMFFYNEATFTTVKNCYFHDIGSNRYNYAIYSNASDGLYENNEVTSTGGYGIHLYDDKTWNANNNLVQKNYIHDVGTSGLNSVCMLLAQTSGQAADNSQAINNICANAQYGIVLSTNASNGKIYHNTIYNCATTGIEVGSGASNTLIKNNIMWQNGSSDAISNSGSGTVTSNNLQNTNPSFVGGTNYHLQSGSAARNFGTNLLTAVPTDKDGVARDTVPDAGAYEFV